MAARLLYFLGLAVFAKAQSWEHDVTCEQLLAGATLQGGDIIQMTTTVDPCIPATKTALTLALSSAVRDWKALKLIPTIVTPDPEQTLAEIEKSQVAEVVHISRDLLLNHHVILYTEAIIGVKGVYRILQPHACFEGGVHYRLTWTKD